MANLAARKYCKGLVTTTAISLCTSYILTLDVIRLSLQRYYED